MTEKGLDPDTIAFILKTTLRPEHYEDEVLLKFISSYMNCRDVAQASREAGVTTQQGRAMRNRKDIHNAISKLTEQAVLKNGFDAGELIEKVKEVVYIDPVEFENPDGSYKTSMSQIKPEARRAVKKFKVRNTYEKDPNGMDIITGQIIEIELYDKMKGVELLGREVATFKETSVVEHDITSNMKAVLLGARERAEGAVRELNAPVIEGRGVRVEPLEPGMLQPVEGSDAE
jgi:hypothetical protein